MSESTDPLPESPSARRRLVASVAYLIVALLVGVAIAREFMRVKQGKPAARLDLFPSENRPV